MTTINTPADINFSNFSTNTITSNTTGDAAGAPPSGSAGRDLSGTFPNPTVSKINGSTVGSSTPTSGNLLIGSGSQWVTQPVSGNITINSSGVTTIGSSQVTNSMLAGSIDLTTKVTSVLPNANGGTNQSTYATGDTLYASATNTLSKLAGNTTTTKKFLNQTGNGTISGAPVWNTIASSDVPGSALTSSNDTNVTITLGGSPSTALLNAASLTMGWTGQLALSRGGLNANLTASNGGIFYSTASAGAILSGTATANQMLLSGASGAPSWSASTIPSTYTTGDTLYASASNTLTQLTGNITTTKKFLTQTGNGSASVAPGWNTISSSDVPGSALTSGNDTNVTLTLGGTPSTALLNAASITAGWTGQLSLARGGTNANLTASNGGIFYSTASAGAILAGTATANQMLLSGASGAPSWSTTTIPATSGTANTVLKSNGTNFVNSTSTYSDSYTANNLLYASASNTVGGLATGNNGVLVTSNTGVPSISSTLPSAVQSNITQLGAIAALSANAVVTTDGSSNLSSVASASSYTPTIGDGTNNFTTTTAIGKYYKVGPLYFVSAQLIWSSKGSASAGSNLVISIPAADGANDIRICPSFGFVNGLSWSLTQLTATVDASASVIKLWGISSIGMSPSQLTVSSASTSGEIQFNLFFWNN